MVAPCWRLWILISSSLQLLSITCWALTNISLSVRSDASLWGVVADEHVSYTLDWWSASQDVSWGNASVVNADLSSPELRAAARALSPAFLRIGGSQADTIIYHFDTDTCEPRNHCFTMKQWDRVLEFAESVGARIVFCLNYLSHTTVDGVRDQKDWDSTNARDFLNYTSRHAPDGLVYGFELGNELTHNGKATDLTRMRLAYEQLRLLINSFWQPPGIVPKLVGPAATGYDGFEYVMEELGNSLDIITYHKYHGPGRSPELETAVLEPTFYHHAFLARDVMKVVTKYYSHRKEPQLWIGEGAMAYNSGRPNVTDSLVSSLWFANVVSALSKTRPLPHAVYCRQALIGGYYELIQHATLEPNPDFWLARTYKALVGRGAVGPILSPQRTDSLYQNPQVTWGCCQEPGQDTILAHAFCAKPSAATNQVPGDLVFVIINIAGNESFALQFPFGTSRSDYVMTGYENGESSSVSALGVRHVQINGQLQQMTGDRLLPLTPNKATPSQAMLVPPYSVSFAVIHGASIESCQQLYRQDDDSQNKKSSKEPFNEEPTSSLLLGSSSLSTVSFGWFGLGLLLIVYRWSRMARRAAAASALTT